MGYQYVGQTKGITDSFSGLVRGERIRDGAWNDMQNMTTDKAPVAATRERRLRIGYYDNEGAEALAELPGWLIDSVSVDNDVQVLTGGGYVYNGNTGVHIGGHPHELDEDLIAIDRRLYTNGKLIEFRGGNNRPTTIRKAGDRMTGAPTNQVFFYGTVVPCTTDTMEQDPVVSDTAPGSPATGALWYDYTVPALKQYTGSAWQTVETSLLKIKPFREPPDEYPRTGSAWAEGETWVDYVSGLVYTRTDSGWDGPASYTAPESIPAEGIPAEDMAKYIRVKSDPDQYIPIESMRTLAEILYSAPWRRLRRGDAINVLELHGGPSGEVVVEDVLDDGAIVIPGILHRRNPDGTINIFGPANKFAWEIRAPILDHVISHNNRVWGCRYGENDKGEFVNEIYASRLGDVTNFFNADKDNDDAWMQSVGLPGAWTGVGVSGDSVIFFKVDGAVIITGSTPSTFRAHTILCHGVQAGSEKSIVSIGGYLYYKSEHGIMRMSDGGYPVCVSRDLGPDVWTNAVAGTDGRHYYVLMYERRVDPAIYVYDTEQRTWTKEAHVMDGTTRFVRYKDNLLAVNMSAELEPSAPDYKAVFAGWECLTKDDDLQPYVAYIVNTLNADGIDMTAEWFETGGNSAGMTRDGLLAITTALENLGLIGRVMTEAVRVHYTYVGADRAVWVNSDTTDDKALLPGMILNADDPTTGTALKSHTVTEGPFDWKATTGAYGLGDPDDKRIRVVQIRVKTTERTRFKCSIMLDEDGRWIEIYNVVRGKNGTHRIVYSPAQRCECYRLKLEGNGDAVVYSIAHLKEAGGDYVY